MSDSTMIAPTHRPRRRLGTIAVALPRAVAGLARRSPAGVAALAFLVMITLAATVMPRFLPDPNLPNYSQILAGPSWSHPFGTDDLGRDTFTRLVVGTRTSLFAALFATSVSIVIGLPIGLLAGYLRGPWDATFMRVADTILSFPALVLALGLSAALGSNLRNAMLAVGIVLAPTIARLARSRALIAGQSQYVEAARLYGAPHRRVLWRHVIPNSIQPVIVQGALIAAIALIGEASLSFLGLGVAPPQASLGTLLSRSFRYMASAPLQMLAPGVMIMLLALAFNVLGEASRVWLDPRSRSAKRRWTPATSPATGEAVNG